MGSSTRRIPGSNFPPHFCRGSKGALHKMKSSTRRRFLYHNDMSHLETFDYDEPFEWVLRARAPFPVFSP